MKSEREFLIALRRILLSAVDLINQRLARLAEQVPPAVPVLVATISAEMHAQAPIAQNAKKS